MRIGKRSLLVFSIHCCKSNSFRGDSVFKFNLFIYPTTFSSAKQNNLREKSHRGVRLNTERQSDRLTELISSDRICFACHQPLILHPSALPRFPSFITNSHSTISNRCFWCVYSGDRLGSHPPGSHNRAKCSGGCIGNRMGDVTEKCP